MCNMNRHSQDSEIQVIFGHSPAESLSMDKGVNV